MHPPGARYDSGPWTPLPGRKKLFPSDSNCALPMALEKTPRSWLSTGVTCILFSLKVTAMPRLLAGLNLGDTGIAVIEDRQRAGADGRRKGEGWPKAWILLESRDSNAAIQVSGVVKQRRAIRINPFDSIRVLPWQNNRLGKQIWLALPPVSKATIGPLGLYLRCCRGPGRHPGDVLRSPRARTESAGVEIACECRWAVRWVDVELKGQGALLRFVPWRPPEKQDFIVCSLIWWVNGF